MLPTIISRTQTLTVSPLSAEALKKIVPDCTPFEYSYCGGNPGTLLRLSADKEFRKFRADTSKIIADLICGGEDKVYDCAEFFEENKDRKADLMSILTLLVRDAFYKNSGLNSLIVNTDMMHLVDAVSAKCTSVSSAKMLKEILDAEGGVLGKYSNYAMAVSAMLIKIRYAISKQEDK